MAVAGKVAITPRGSWNAETSYVKLDFVGFNGSSYVALQPSVGIEPTDTNYWMLSAIGNAEGGERNLVPFPYYEESGTESGITWTVNDDGTIGVSGTATADVSFTIKATSELWKLPNGTYKLIGCPSGGSFNTYRLQLARFVDRTLTSYGQDYGNGVTFSITDNEPLLMQFVVRSGVTIDSVIKPMLVSVNLEYAPYYFGGAEKAKTAETLGDYLPSDFLKLKGGGTVEYTDFNGFKVKRNVENTSQLVGIAFQNATSTVGAVGFKNDKLYRTDVSGTVSAEILDTSNKLSGTYNGVTDERDARLMQIAESGKTIGNLLYIETDDGFGLICSNGGVYFGPSVANQYKYFHTTDISYADGILKISPGEVSGIFNQSGIVYKYSLL